MIFRTTIAAAAAFAAIATICAADAAPAGITALLDEMDADAAAPAKPALAEPEAPAAPVAAPAKEEKPAIQEEKAAEAEKPAVEQKPAVEEAAQPEAGKRDDKAQKKKPKPKKELTGRDAKITSETMSFDRKEGIIFFDRKVYVDDEQYQMHADRVYVFLSGTNDVKRLVALGNVALTNEFRSATCDKAVYVKAASKVVLYAPENGVATLKDESEKGGTITGSRITFWLDSEQVEVQQSDITVPGGAFKAGDAKKLLGN